MVCSVCGKKDFITSEYRVGACRAPALECTSCRALNLTKEAANSQEERYSIETAIAARSEVLANGRSAIIVGVPATDPR